MSTHTVFSFLIYAIINAITPGPGNLLALNTVVRFGWQKSKRLLFGVFVGYYVVQVICAILVYGLEQQFNQIIGVMKYIGAIYILWLVIHIVRSKPDFGGTSKQPLFWTGFLLQFVNVKIYLFGITALTGYVSPYYQSLGMLLIFEMFIASIGTVATLLWAAFGGLFKKLYIKYFRIVNIILALALLECVVSLLFL